MPDSISGADFSYFSYGDDDEVVAKVFIDKSHVQWVESNLDVPIELNENGDGIAEFVVKNYESFISRVLLLLDHAEILEPDFLRQKLIERLKRLQDSSEEVMLKATERLERLVSMVPWLIENNGATIDELEDRFQYPRQTLLNDLTKFYFCWSASAYAG